MTQAYAARSPNYWGWIGGSVLVFAVAVAGWATFGGRERHDVVPPAKNTLVLPRQTSSGAAARSATTVPPAIANAVAEGPPLSSANSDDELLSRIGDLEGKLRAERGRVEQYRLGLVSLSNEYNTVVAQNQRYREAIQEALHAPAAPAEPEKIFVSHLGQPWIVPIGWDSFTVSGEFYSAENTPQQGKATIDLYLAGVKADTTSFELNLPPHSSVPYQVTFTPRKTYMTSAAVVAAIPRWAPLK